MIVCICRRVSDKTIRTAVEGGARTVEEVSAACRAGNGCGACHEAIADMIDQHAACADCPRVRLTVVSPYQQAAGSNA